jgi:hypothetical protein
MAGVSGRRGKNGATPWGECRVGKWGMWAGRGAGRGGLNEQIFRYNLLIKASK